MEYILSFIFLLLNLYSYQYGINSIVFLFLSGTLFLGMYYFSYKRTDDFLTASMMMMCHTWQASWTDIFGIRCSDTAGIQITWFYMVGLLVVFYCLIHIRETFSKKLPPITLAMFFGFMIIMIYPIILSPSKANAMKEFLVSGFFFVLAFVAFIFKDKVTFEKREFVVDAYIFNITASSAFLIIQYFAYKFWNVKLFISFAGTYFGNSTFSAKLIMGDTSCSTILIAAAIFFIFERLNKTNWVRYGIVSLIILVGLATTARRTSSVPLCIFIVIYVLFHYKGTGKKVMMTAASLAMIAVLLYYLSESRSITSLDALLYDNGRFEGFQKSWEIFKDNIFGVGYDNSNILNLMSYYIVHNTFLRWLNMGGIPFTLMATALVISFIVYAYKKDVKTEFWFLIYSFAASNLIPDLLSSRLIVLPVMMVFIFKETEKYSDEKSPLVQSRNQLQSRV